MFIVSLHRNLKKERNNYEHAANTPRYEHASVTSTMLAKCSPKWKGVDLYFVALLDLLSLKSIGFITAEDEDSVNYDI